MKKFLLINIIFVSNISFSQSSGVFKDSRDGVSYKTTIIGTQTWTTENLNTTKFRNGDVIPQAKTWQEWQRACDNQIPAWCYYNDREIQNDPVNGEKYGKLYNWYAVTDPRGLAPMGWHIPSDSDWTRLTNSLGGENISGIKLKGASGWDENGNGNSSTSFNGLPSGSRYGTTFALFGTITYFWSSTSLDENKAYTRSLGCCHNEFKRISQSKCDGNPVRIVKD